MNDDNTSDIQLGGPLEDDYYGLARQLNKEEKEKLLEDFPFLKEYNLDDWAADA